jgi:hypothetical protein
MDDIDRWRSDDDADAPPPDAAWDYHDKRVIFSGSAREALWAAARGAAADGRDRFGSADLLRAVTATDNRAVEVLDRIGVDRETWWDRPVDDGLPESLVPTRDALLGRTGYWTANPMGWLGSAVLRVTPFNYARYPAIWIQFEAMRQARLAGRLRPGTVHILLAVLAAYEVSRAYPRLVGPAESDYAGARRLAARGVTYDAGLATLAGGRIAPRPDRLMRVRSGDTAVIIRAVTIGDTAARRLLAALDAEP